MKIAVQFAEPKVFRLIKTLSSAEIMFFKKYAQIHHHDQSQYVQLFDILQKQQDWNAAQIEKKLLKASLLASYSVLKSYLYQKILDALQLYHQQEAHFENSKQEVELLIERGLYPQAMHILQTIKEQVVGEKKWSFLLQLLHLEQLMVGVYWTKNHQENKQRILQEIEEATTAMFALHV